MIRFENRDELSVGIKYTQGKEAIKFEVACAIELKEYGDDSYALMNGGIYVKHFDDAMRLVKGRVFFEDKSEKITYLISFYDEVMFRKEFEALISIIQNEILVTSEFLLKGKELPSYEKTQLVNYDPGTII
jgi:hypothetical protein